VAARIYGKRGQPRWGSRLYAPWNAKVPRQESLTPCAGAHYVPRRNAQLNALVVDDTPINVKRLGALLEENDLIATIATSGEAALELVSRQP
jgi:PleD family two-component response regulator